MSKPFCLIHLFLVAMQKEHKDHKKRHHSRGKTERKEKHEKEKKKERKKKETKDKAEVQSAEVPAETPDQPAIMALDDTEDTSAEVRLVAFSKLFTAYNGMLVPVRTSFGLHRRGGKTYNVST